MNENAQVLFSECASLQRPIPNWVQGMLRIGLDWPSGPNRSRRIGVISMPCDSAAFGLIALGLMLRDLGRADATDIHLHHQRVISYARRYLAQKCSREEIPDSHRLTGILKLIPKDPSQKVARYEILGIVGGAEPGVKVRQLQARSRLNGSEPAEIVFTRHRTQRLSIEGSPIPDVRTEACRIDPEPFKALVPGLLVEEANLKQSYTGLCVAGRTEGERPTRAVLKQVAFDVHDQRFPVDELLHVAGWTVEKATRTQFLNTRGGVGELQVDSTPDVVVVDGLQAFTKVVHNPKLRYADIVMVYHRAVEREFLDELGSQIAVLQKYMLHIDRGASPLLPSAIHYSILEGQE